LTEEKRRAVTPDYLRALIGPQCVAVDESVWQAAAVLAGLRRATNEPHRARDRDRGGVINRHNDLLGAFTELVALGVCEQLPDVQVQHALLDLAGSVDDVDLVLTRRSTLKLEAKGHFFGPGKTRLAINKRAHDRSVSRGAHGYLPIFTVPGSARVFVGRIFPIAEVDSWNVEMLGRHRDPARTTPLGAAVTAVVGASEHQVLSACLDARLAVDLAAWDARGAAALPALRRQRFALPTAFADVVRALQEAAVSGT
jgi:hypothetical protein